ncbi:hypothetical protein CA11_15680 [Gimesia maris]|uniref:hypothetical protein n=1 Tax=Gimesia maris TaxID=122 RepID=UPI001188566F|nr:hypothetical protein [Gimesia maris]QDU13782.1 hypothetical protein CA11_15680 [Gimesia maris]
MRLSLLITVMLIYSMSMTDCSGEDQVTNTTSLQDETVEQNLQAPLILEFIQADWHRVSRAADIMERRPQQALPVLVCLLDQDRKVKLQNTADLIYPGAEMFYGHGGIINYDIDQLSVRAGWLLEMITFEDFGFSEPGIDHDQLLAAAIAGKKDVPADDVLEINSDEELRKEKRSAAVARAKKWWQSNQSGWTRRAALEAAIRSDNPYRVANALEWIRHSEIPINGMSRQWYVKEIYPVVKQIAQSNEEENAEQASLLVENYQIDEWYWYDSKTVTELAQ